MGGKALTCYDVYTERKETKEFKEIGFEISNIIFTQLNLETFIAECFRDKKDHGDLDLLVKIDKEIKDKNIDIKQYIQETFNPRAVYHNSNVYSFDYNNFQIDFICIDESDFETAKIYYSFDPLAEVMGKTFNKFGLSYGWNGLFYKFRKFHGSLPKDILISKDVRKIFEFGGFDYDRYLQGFDSIEDIYKYIISSKYFDLSIFKLENLNSKHRKRNKKRKFYYSLLEYLDKNNINISYPFEKNKDNYLPLIFEAFPESNLLEELNLLKKEDEINRMVSSKFNGDIIMRWLPKIKPANLGISIRKFKEYLGKDYKDFILNNEETTIRELFLKIYNEIQ